MMEAPYLSIILVSIDGDHTIIDIIPISQMDCILRHIGRYPFDINNENNLVALTYTCLVDAQTADILEIESHAYRYITTGESVAGDSQEVMLLVIRDEQLLECEVDPVLHVPYNILRLFADVHPRVVVRRKPIEMQTAILPKMREALEVNLYFNSGFAPDQAIVGALTKSEFVMRTGDCYLWLGWMRQTLKGVRDMRLQL